MNLGAIIDVSIGLILCYLLLGMIGSTLQELFAGFFDLRARSLRDGLKALLQHGAAAGVTPLFDKVWGHALVKPAGITMPSYLPARNFSLALFDALAGGSRLPAFSQIEQAVAALPAGPAKESLTALVVHAAGDLDALKQEVERWFDDAMDRVGGLYKRMSNYYMLVFGLVAAIGLNVDTLNIAQKLWLDPAARQAAVTAATAQISAAGQGGADAGNNVSAAATQLEALSLPIGWNGPVQFRLSMLLGWLVTALGVSLGAPFWFDTLRSFLNLRTSGPKPARSDAAAGAGKGRKADS